MPWGSAGAGCAPSRSRSAASPSRRRRHRRGRRRRRRWLDGRRTGAANLGSGFGPRTPSALRLVAHPVQLALSRNRRRRRRKRPQHARRRSTSWSAAPVCERNDRILDLCCGQGRHSLELARRGFPHVTGLDRSRYLIRLATQARQAARLAGLVPRGRRPPISASATANFIASASSATRSAISTAPRTISRFSKRSSAPWPRAARWSWI